MGTGLGPKGAPALLPAPAGTEAPNLFSELCCPPLCTEDDDFLEPVSPKSLEMPELLFPWKPSPTNLEKEELGSPHHPTPPLLQPTGGPKLKIIPLPQNFPAGALLLLH